MREVADWKPNPKQKEFIKIPFDVKEALYGGAVFGGKSEMLRMLPLIYGFHLNPDFQGVLFRRTFPELEASHIIKAEQDGYYHLAGGKYNKQDHIWRFPSGAIMRFSYCEDNNDARAHDSAEYNLMCFDELTHFSEWQYRYLTSRCRTSKVGLPAIIRSGSMPGNIGHVWVRDRFIDPHPAGGVLLLDKFTQTSRIFVPARLQDNKAGLEADPTYINTLNILPEGERKAKIEGDWYGFSGQVFTEFRETRLPDDPPNAVHVVEPFAIPSFWPKILSIDWGYIHPTYACWGAISPDKRIFIYREYSVEKTNVSVWASDIARLSQMDENIAVVIMDPSAWQQRGQDKTIAGQFMDVSGMMCDKADNDRLGGKMLYHDYLRWKQRPARYVPREGFDIDVCDRIFRLHGDKARNDYVALFKPQAEETNLPILQIMSSCPILIKTIQVCIYDEKKQGKADVKVEDVAKFVGDDAYDCSRYMLKEVEKYWYGVDEQYKRIQERAKVLEDRGKSETNFYMQMDRLDKQGSHASRPIRRFH